MNKCHPTPFILEKSFLCLEMKTGYLRQPKSLNISLLSVKEVDLPLMLKSIISQLTNVTKEVENLKQIAAVSLMIHRYKFCI